MARNGNQQAQMLRGHVCSARSAVFDRSWGPRRGGDWSPSAQSMLLPSAMTIDFKHLVVAIDFASPSQCALDAAIELARRFDSHVTLVHVYEIPAYAYSEMTYATADLFRPMQKLASESLEKTRREVEQRLPGTEAVLRCGLPATEILSVIEEVHPDLVVIGTHGRTGVKHLFLGSVAEKVVRLSPVPVLTMHEAKRS